MSTLTEYLSLGIFAEDQPERWTSEYTVEVPAGQDDLSNYVTLNLWNSGNNLANFGYMSSQGFTTNYNGWYIDDTDIFDFSDEDFTVRLQFGLGSYYAYNELEGQSTIPVLCMGPGQVYDSPFLVAMTNPGATSNVQKGDLFFSLRDTADNEAYCYLSSSDWYLPTYASKFHMEISRRGSVFSLRYNGLYGQKEVNNTFASFGSLDISGMTRSYIMSSPITGSVNNAFYGLQITKGISRTVGPNCIGKYAKTFGYPSQPMIRRRHSEDLMCKNLVVPVVGLRATPPALSVVADTGACANDETANGNVLTNDSGQYLRVTKVSGSVNSVGVEVAGSAGGLFTIDARGNWAFDPDGDFDSLTGEDTATTSVTYHASDGTAEAMATLTITVSHANAAPVAVDDAGETSADATTSGNVLTNDTDADLDTLTVSQVAGSAANVGVAVAGTNGGLFTVGSNGAWSFDPDGDFASLTGTQTATTSVTYHVSDGVAEDEGTLTVTVSAAGATDEYWPNVKLCIQLPSNAIDGSTAIYDAKGHTVTVVGNAQIDTAPGHPVILMDGNGDSLTVATGTDLQVLAGDWTLEALVRSDAAKNHTICQFNAGSNGGLHLWIDASGYPVVDNGLVGTTHGNVAVPLSSETWVRVTKSSGVIRAYVGTVQALTHTAQAYTVPTQAMIGKFGGLTTYNWRGAIRALRFTAGVVRDMTSVPTLPFPTA